jgi:hypothetical protein
MLQIVSQTDILYLLILQVGKGSFQPSLCIISILLRDLLTRDCVVCGYAGAGVVGVNYGTVANNLPTPAATAKLILSTSLRSVKLYDADVSILQALANTNIKVETFLIQSQTIIDEFFLSMSIMHLSKHVAPLCHIIITSFQFTRSSNIRSDLEKNCSEGDK